MPALAVGLENEQWKARSWGSRWLSKPYYGRVSLGAGGNVNPLHWAGRKQTGRTPLVKGERLLEEAGSTLDRQEKHQLLHGFEIEGLLSPRLPET